MNYFEFMTKNAKADEAAKFGARPQDINKCSTEIGYRGFVNCVAADHEDSFVMFTNADDVVAGHYYYAGLGSFEHGTLKLWCHLAKRASWIYDIGAFTGVFSLAAVAANPQCFVMAFEPSFVTYSRLLVNIHANEFNSRIAPMRYGVADKNGELELRHPSGVYVMASGESFLETQICNPWFTESVPVVTLDYLLGNQSKYSKEIVIDNMFNGCDLLKIDVEGFEINVLKGMQDVIGQHKPTAIVEILENAHVAEILELFGPEYRVWHIVEESGALSDTPVGTNKLFIHKDRLSLLDGYASPPQT